MSCPICETADSSVHISLCNADFDVCFWCANRIREFIHGNTNQSVSNILWGFGRLGWSDWFAIREFIRKYSITEVLEFGTGLSTELFVNEGLKVVSCDVLSPLVTMYKKLSPMQGNAEFHHYEYQHMLDFDTLYPGRKWRFVFVDGGQERSEEVKAAMKLSTEFIFLHDPNLGEQSFFPDDEWKVSDGDAKLYRRN